VADLHLRAMTNPAAKGERFLAVAGESWLVRALALFVHDMKAVTPELGKQKNISNQKAKRLLGWNARTNEEAILATGQSLLQLGMVKN
jgi:nucleoside-diphosphate-sugar epimerase